jgi:hypothetical protein
MVSIPALDELRGLNVTATGVLAGIISAVGILIVGLLNFLIFLALSEFIYVQIDIEHNTRQTAEYMRQTLALQQATLTPPPAATPTVAVAPALLPDEAFAPTPTITTPTPPAAS